MLAPEETTVIHRPNSNTSGGSARHEAPAVGNLEPRASRPESARHVSDATVRSATTAPPDALVGARVGGYRVERYLLDDELGRVFRGRDMLSGRAVALKVADEGPAGDPQSRARFHNETFVLQRICHPRVPMLYDAGQDAAGRAWMATELTRGETLAQRMAREPVTPAEVLEWMCQLYDALAAIHRQGIVHRDVRQQNVALTRSEGAHYVMLTGFGIAAVPEFAAPRVSGCHGRTGATDVRADIDAAAVIFFELLMGRPMESTDTRPEVLAATLDGLIPRLLPAGAPSAANQRAMVRLLTRCLAPRSDARPTAHELACATAALQVLT